MKKITLEEFQALQFKVTGGSRPKNRLYNTFDILEVWECLLIEKNDWAKKTPPDASINAWFKKTGKKFSVRSLADNSGWAVVRVK